MYVSTCKMPKNQQEGGKRMNICIPVGTKEGLQSNVYGHFGSAPYFALYNTQSTEIEVIDNRNLHHAHGQCNPIGALGGRHVDMIVTGGIGGRALQKLNASGIKAYHIAQEQTIQEVIKSFEQNTLRELRLQDACTHHRSCS